LLLSELVALFVMLGSLEGPLKRSLAFRSSPGWPYVVGLYVRTVVYVVAGLASISAVLTLSQPHDHLGTVAKLAISSPLGLLAYAIGIWSAVAVAVIGARVRRPPDPYPKLLLGLLKALDDLGIHKQESSGTVLSEWVRCRVAEALERPARALAANAGMSSRVAPEFSPEVICALVGKGWRVAAWIADVQVQILWPQTDGGEAARQKLARGLIDACACNWEALERERSPVPEGGPGRVARMLPRIVLTLLLLAAAFVVPDLLGKAVSAAARGP
jgi:hypothetical protein